MTTRALLLTAALLMTLPASADEPNDKQEGKADPLAVFVTEFVVLTPGENGFPAELPKIGERPADAASVAAELELIASRLAHAAPA